MDAGRVVVQQHHPFPAGNPFCQIRGEDHEVLPEGLLVLADLFLCGGFRAVQLVGIHAQPRLGILRKMAAAAAEHTLPVAGRHCLCDVLLPADDEGETRQQSAGMAQRHVAGVLSDARAFCGDVRV